MDKRIKESISALMDDEANELEVRRVLSHTEEDELRDVWQRYHVVRNVMQTPSFNMNDIDISAAVSASIEDDVQTDEVESPRAQKPVSRFNRYVSVASAACMLFAFALILGQGQDVSGPSSVPTVAEISSNSDEGLQKVAATEGPKIVVEMTQEQAKTFNQYLLRHAEHAAFGGGTRNLPLARVASFNAIGI